MTEEIGAKAGRIEDIAGELLAAVTSLCEKTGEAQALELQRRRAARRAIDAFMQRSGLSNDAITLIAGLQVAGVLEYAMQSWGDGDRAFTYVPEDGPTDRAPAMQIVVCADGTAFVDHVVEGG